MYLLFYPEEEEFLRFRDFRGKFVGERRARRAYRFQNSAEDQKSAADTISVHEKKIRRVAAARRPWLNFEHDPAALVCPIQRISKRFKQPRFSNANNLFSLLSLSYPNYYPNGKKEYSWFVTRNRKYKPRVFFREKKKGGTFEKIFERIESLRYVREQRNIFPKMDTSSIHIYIYIYIPRFIDSLSKLGPLSLPPFSPWFIIPTRIRRWIVLRNYSSHVGRKNGGEGGRRKAAYRVESPG